MAGARKRVYQTFHTSGRGDTGHGSESPKSMGDEGLNQTAPGLHMVDRCPPNEHEFDENFAHRTGEGEKNG